MKRNTSYFARPHAWYRAGGRGGYQLPRGRARSKRRAGATYLNHSQGFGRRRGYRASGPNKRKPYAIIAIGCAALFFLACVIWYVNRSVDITVNGETVGVRINSTIEQYIEDNDLANTYDAGNLLAVDDTVLERGGGSRYTVTLNGKAVDADAYSTTEFTGGEELKISDGADVYEDHDVEATTIEPTLTLDGSGAIQYVDTWGIPGRSEIWTGKQSGKTADRGVVQEVQNAVVRSLSVVPDDDRKVVALTFDEGPSSYTQQLVQLLQQNNVQATFFMSGDAVEANPTAAKAIVDAGFEIGSNGYSDTDMSELSADEVRQQITSAADAIEQATGTRPTVLRAPYAAFSEQNWCDAMDLVSAVVSWNVDSGDWLLPGASSVVSNVTSSVTTGNIVLFTDSDATGDELLEALPQIISTLREQGYEFVTLSDLIASEEELGKSLDISKISMSKDATLPSLPSDDDTDAATE